MGLPSKLKNMNLFSEGLSYLGEVSEVTLPKLTRKLEPWRGGGMDAPVKIDMGGGDDLDLEWTIGGLAKAAFSTFGAAGVSATGLRFVGYYQADDSGAVSTVEIECRGRHEEIDMGTAKPGEGGEQKMKTALAYYKLTIDGQERVEIDRLNLVFVVDGADRLAEMRAAIS